MEKRCLIQNEEFLSKMIILSREGGFLGRGAGGSDLSRDDGSILEVVRDDLLTISTSEVGDRPFKLPLD